MSVALKYQCPRTVPLRNRSSVSVRSVSADLKRGFPTMTPTRTIDSDEQPRILPIALAESEGNERGQQWQIGNQVGADRRMAEGVRLAVDRMQARLASVCAGLRASAIDPADHRLERAAMIRMASEVDAVSQALEHIGDLVAPDRPAAKWVSLSSIFAVILADAACTRSDLNLPPLKVAIDVADEHAIHADPAMIRRIFTTLLGNALEAVDQVSGACEVPQMREIVVTSIDYPDAIEIEVADSGPGLWGQTQSRLFEPGFTTKPDGAGLSLAAARALVEQLGGTLHAANCPEGGTAFTLRLPQKRASRMAA